MIGTGSAPRLARPPSASPDPDECFYYHSTDLGASGAVEGQWNLAPHLDRYWAGTDFRGKRVLEIGPASGFLTAALERRGADVVCLELAAGEDWDVVPYCGWDPSGFLAARAELQRRMRNAFWRTHAALGLEADLLLGSAYHIPPEVGEFDIATICAVLLHLRHPLDALQQVAARVSERVVVAEPLPGECLDDESLALLRDADATGDGTRLAARLAALDRGALHGPVAAYFRPRPAAQTPKETWWSFAPALLETWLELLGFGVETSTLYLLEHDSTHAFHKPADHEDRRTFHPYFSLAGRRR